MQRINRFDSEKANALVKRLAANYFDEVAVIDANTLRVLNVSEKFLGKPKSERKFDGMLYDEQLEKTIKDNPIIEDSNSIFRAMQLKTVKKELENKEIYSFEVYFGNSISGIAVCKELSFCYLDESKELIVLASQDISKIIANEKDPMTGLFNTAGFQKRASNWLKENPGRKFRVQRYNIDRFRDINGIYGYEVGNRLLKDFGAYMKEHDTQNSFSAHLNADHFVRFCADDEATPDECFERCLRCFKDYDLKLPIRLHIGVYDLCEPDCDIFTMSYKALLALQSIKGSLSKHIAYYEKGMMATEAGQQELLADIQTAIDEEQFEVWFQPQLDFSENKIIGAEALVRWRHPERGLIFPGEFIPLLEKSDYIGAVDSFVFRKVCDYIKKWKDLGYGVDHMPVSVNLSRNDMLNESLCDELLSDLGDRNIPPKAVNLEITESAYVGDTDFLFETINKFRNSGFRIEMDDFGSGYSSLNTLKDINIDKLKLDMKFLSNTKDTSRSKIIIAAIVEMATSLGLSVIAEGVETEEQAKMLSDCGCNQMQGYYFSRPVPEAEYEEMLRKQSGK